jgi:hypothetical protein
MTQLDAPRTTVESELKSAMVASRIQLTLTQRIAMRGAGLGQKWQPDLQACQKRAKLIFYI